MLNINEIFRSIDGEVCGKVGSIGMQGGWTIFIRLQGCNLSCSYCDTQYARTFDVSNELSNDFIINKVEILSKKQIKKVTITGGEPLLERNFPDILYLLEELNEKGYGISIETNGSQKIYRSLRNFVDSFIVDIKTPSSGNPTLSIEDKNFHLLNDNDFFKFVIADEEDFLWSIERKNKLHYIARETKCVMSPIFKDGKMTVNPVALMEKYNDFGFNISLQIHKLLEVK